MSTHQATSDPIELLTREPSGRAARFLIPVDLSEASERAMRWTLEQRAPRGVSARVLLLPSAEPSDAGDLVRFLSQFDSQSHAMVHGQVLHTEPGDLDQLTRAIAAAIERESIQSIVIGLGGPEDDATRAGALAQHLAKHCGCSVVVVPARQPVYELIRVQ